ncbi:MAG: pectin esterase [Prevotella sp.]|nr:pectin esterase [Prevotella sp.]
MNHNLLRFSLSYLLAAFVSAASAEDVTAQWDWQNAVPASVTETNIQGTDASGQVDSDVEGIALNVKAAVAGTNIKLQYNASGYAQFNKNTEIDVPVGNAGDVVTVVSYPGQSNYTVGGTDATGQNTFSYTAKSADATKGYVPVVATATAYLYSIKVEMKTPQGPATLDNEPATASFPFNLGTDGQTATFSQAAYFLNSKVTYGSNLTLDGKDNKGHNQTWFNPAAKETNAAESNAIRFIVTPKPGLRFTATKVSFKATRYGTNGGYMDIAWQNADGTTLTLDTNQRPNRDSDAEPVSQYAYDISGATAGDGPQGLLINLYSLDPGKHVGYADIVVEGTLSGTEQAVPILASFKINGTEYSVDDVFGQQYEATLELSKTEAMVSTDNPLTDITAATGELGTVTYTGNATACTVTIPVSAGSTTINYVLKVVQKSDFTLTYINTDGSVIGTQTIEKDQAIGTFAYSIEAATSTEGKQARGWFKHNYVGEKYAVTDLVTANIRLYAIQTEIEGPSDSRKYVFDLTDPFFYDEDHEAFNSVGNGRYYNNHGWVFASGDRVELLVGRKATVMLKLCAYSADTQIAVSNGQTVAAKAETDGAVGGFAYEGDAGTVTLTFNGTTYLHGITILNTTTTNYERHGDTFTVKAGDGSSFIDALDAANGEPAGNPLTIYLPNGTYDLGQATLTTIGRDNITIKGESQHDVVIRNLPTAEGIGVTATLLNTSKNLTLESLTLKNDYPYYDPQTGKAAANAGRAVCLQDKGNYTVCRQVTMLSYQDTYYSNNSNGQFYFDRCEIHGLVDFVCGGGDVFYENTTFYLESRELTEGAGGVTIAAPNGGKQFGYVMDHCTVDCHSKEFNFGRSWGSFAGLAWLNTTLLQPTKIISTRFTVAGMNSAADNFKEYRSMDTAGNVVSPGTNVINFTHSSGNKEYETILTDTEANVYSKADVFADAPAEFKTRVGIGTADAIGEISGRSAAADKAAAVYNMQGQRVSSARRGLYIQNGRKFIIK